MLFNSWSFLAFFAVVFPTYYLLPRLGIGGRGQVLALCLASLVFYAYELPILVVLLMASVAFNTVMAACIVRTARRSRWLTIGVIVNLTAIAIFKYAALLLDTAWPESELARWAATIPLPIGISFYTFHSISLLVDLYARAGVQSIETTIAERRDVDAFTRIVLYIAFFPQLIAGPIVKAHQFFGQIGAKAFRDIPWDSATRNLITGYFLKMVIADNLKDVTPLLTSDKLPMLGRVDLVALLYGYSCQIFADFAGYSLIAIGLAQLFGYKLPDNFNFPYLSASVTEFWRRWHISLSSFLRDYLYIPLGGNRKGPWRTYLNLFIVMFLGGLWHGAAWRFALWGVSHGVLLAIEKAWRDRQGFNDRAESGRVAHLLRMFVTFNVVSFLWLTFLMPDVGQVATYVRTLLTTSTLVTSLQNLYIVAVYALPVGVYHAVAYLRERPIAPVQIAVVRPVSLAAMLMLIVLNSGTAGAFIYFQF
jgi:alginate O-acetyltransferase complex protein AlgI